MKKAAGKSTFGKCYIRRAAGAFALTAALTASLFMSTLSVTAESVIVGEESALISTEEITPMNPPTKTGNGKADGKQSKVTAPSESSTAANTAAGNNAAGNTAAASNTAPTAGNTAVEAVEGECTVPVGSAASSAESAAPAAENAETSEAPAAESAAPATETAGTAGNTAAPAAESAAPIDSKAPESAAESTASEAAESEAPTPLPQEDDGHSRWYRSWKMHMLDAAEANQRAHKERILNARLKLELLSDGVELSDSAPIYYICDNGADYLSTTENGQNYVYQACITKAGEYFLASDTVNEAIADHVVSLIDDSCEHSTSEFWNHVLLRDAPQRAYRFSRDRPKDANGVMMVPYYNQGRGYYVNGTWLFTEWPDVTFDVNGHTMHEAGCGFFATAMALSYVLQRIVTPIEFKENGQYIADQGAAHTIGIVTAPTYGVDAYVTGDINEVLMALRNGQPVMEHVGAPPFTNYGHYILLVGVLPDGTIAVNDPGHMDNSYWYNGCSWPVDVITSCAKQPATAYTVFG